MVTEEGDLLKKSLIREFVLLVSSSVLICGLCGSVGAVAGASTSHAHRLSGTYSGPYVYIDGPLTGVSGTMTISHVTGTATGAVGGSVSYSTGGGGKIAGSITGTTVKLKNVCRAKLGCEQGMQSDIIKFTGTVSSRGAAVTGTFTNTTQASAGTWQVTKST